MTLLSFCPELMRKTGFRRSLSCKTRSATKYAKSINLCHSLFAKEVSRLVGKWEPERNWQRRVSNFLLLDNSFMYLRSGGGPFEHISFLAGIIHLTSWKSRTAFSYKKSRRTAYKNECISYFPLQTIICGVWKTIWETLGTEQPLISIYQHTPCHWFTGSVTK